MNYVGLKDENKNMTVMGLKFRLFQLGSWAFIRNVKTLGI